jgi:hypothetical protein
MKRVLAVALLATAMAVASGCGDDEEEQAGTTPATATTAQTTPAERTLTTNVPPRAAAPNIAGGEGRIGAFVERYAADAVGYWAEAFGASGVPYRRPTVAVVARPGDSGCNRPFDPAKEPYFLCAGSNGSRLLFGAQTLDGVRSENGDAGVLFLAGYGAALDAFDQLNGNRLAGGEPVSESYVQGGVCFTGAWVGNLGMKTPLDEDDDDELLALAERFVPGDTELGVSLGRDLMALGVRRGPVACLDEVRG